MVTEQTIEQYLQKLNITFERSGERLWRTGFRGEVKNIDMEIWLSDSVLVVTVPFINAPRKNRTSIYKHLLELNLDLMLAKFGLDNEGDIFLRSEIVADTLSLEQFEQLIMSVVSLHDQFYGQIVALRYSPLEIEETEEEQEDPDEEDAPPDE